MKQYTTDAILLKRINYGEADRILSVITPATGRLSMLAKGVRKQKSKLAGGIELFSISAISYIEGRSELKTIISTRLKKHYGVIVHDVDKTMYAYEILRTVDEMTQHGVESGVYDMLEKTLHYLNEETASVPMLKLWFAVQALEIQGSGLNLEKPLNAPEFSEKGLYQFLFEDMGFAAVSSGTFSPKHIKFLRVVKRAAQPARLHTIDGYQRLASDFEQLSSYLMRAYRT